MTASRKEITAALTKAANCYWAHKNYSCFNEMGIMAWGKYRADVLCLNLKKEIILLEVKSSVADYKTSIAKAETYRQYANRAYWVMTEELFETLKETQRDFWRETNFGVMVLCTVGANAGYLKIPVGCKWERMPKGYKAQIICRMAWRNGISKRTNPRRVRVVIPA